MRVFLNILLGITMTAITLWGVGALYFSPLLPADWRVLAAASYAVATILAFALLPSPGTTAIAALAEDASSVRSAAVGILATNASRVDFDTVSRRIRSLSDAKVRGNLLRVFLEAPKWEAPVFLLGALTDPDDGVRPLAVRLVDRWIEGFNRNQTQPTAKQLQRIGALLDSVGSRMPEATAKMLRFSIKTL